MRGQRVLQDEGGASDLICSTAAARPSPPLHIFTADQVRGELRKLHTRKAAGSDKVCPRLLKSCAAELGAPLQHIFNLSLRLGRVPTLWKTSCLIPVPKRGRPSELNDFRPVALTSHVMSQATSTTPSQTPDSTRNRPPPLQGESGSRGCHAMLSPLGPLLWSHRKSHVL